MKKLIKYFVLFLITILYVACEECDNQEASPCGGSLSSPLIDIVVLIDASGSMNNAATTISQASTIFELGVDTCSADLRIEYFGVEGTFNNTVFDQNHRSYLESISPQSTVYSADINHVGLRTEQGANAISDLSNYMDWRENACRSIFYISDEELDSFAPIGDIQNENEVTSQAIIDANSNNVTVFSHYLTYQDRDPQILQNYIDLSNETGGIHVNTPDATISVDFYESLLPSVICNSCNACKLNDFIN